MSQGCRGNMNTGAMRWCAFLVLFFVHIHAFAEESLENQLVSVDFQLSKQKGGQITVELASAAATVDLRKENGKLVIELHDTDRKSVV